MSLLLFIIDGFYTKPSDYRDILLKYNLSGIEGEYREQWTVELDTTEQLMELQKEIGHPLIVEHPKEEGPPNIQVYDGWIE